MTENSNADNTPPRLLLVDDSKVMRVSAQRILGEQFDVVLAEHGEQAWEFIAEDPEIQAVFTDLGMPFLDGYGLLERIRDSDRERIAHLPVIIVTGKEGDDARADALRRGATDFITKPFNKIDLTARAHAHTENTRKQRVLAENTTVDPLTRLGNRRFLVEKLSQDRAFAARHQQPFSLLALTICNLDRIGAETGKNAAELILKQVASVLRTSIRQEDSAAHLGNGRFAVSLPACDAEGAQLLARRIQRVLDAAAQRQAARGVPLLAVIGTTTPKNQTQAGPEALLEALFAHLTPTGQSGIELAGDSRPAAAEPAAAGAECDQFASAASPLPAAEPPAPDLETALSLIETGKRDEVEPHVGSLLNRLLPLFRLMSARQRRQLVNFLQGGK